MYDDNIKIDLRVKGRKNVKWNKIPDNRVYEVWNFNSGNYLFTTDTK